MRMKSLILATTAAGAVALSAGIANAEPNGWYGAIDAGYHKIGEIETISTTTGPGLTTRIEDNWAGFARL
ncbi:MAG: cell envelope biogenesis protein OmpA, partial [Brevundimonas sp.]